VFAGVHFMAETAKILNPQKLVLLPDLMAGCSLAEGCPADAFRAMRAQHPEHYAITYINCSAEVKAASDVICTSSSAEKIIRQIPATTPILFAPDKNLGRYLIKKTGRDMLLWEGSCVVHETFSLKKILSLQLEHPGADSSPTLSVKNLSSSKRSTLDQHQVSCGMCKHLLRDPSLLPPSRESSTR